MEHYPAVGDLCCPKCKKLYDQEKIWRLTSADTHGESGYLECECGHMIEFKLNLDVRENIYQFKKKIVERINNLTPSIEIEAELSCSIIGNVDLTVKNKKYELYFKNCYKPKVKLKKDELTEECCVCYENCKTTTQCNHRVCHDCYSKLNSCPMCRKELRDNLILRGNIENGIEYYV